MKTKKTIELIDDKTLRRFLDYEKGPCASIFVATHEKRPETQQDPIRLKNLLNEAESELTMDGIGGTAARDLLKPARDLIEDGEFWSYQDRTLALYLAPGVFERFRLPIEMESRVGVDRVFHVVPLLRAAVPDTRFFILSLNKDDVRLLEGSRYSIDEVDLERTPTGMSEFFAGSQFIKSLQFHSGTGSTTKQGRRGAVHHGQGVQDDKNDKERLAHFFQRLDEGIRELLPNSSTPLVLAGQPHVLALYREVSNIENIVTDAIDTNPSSLQDVQLHEKAWEKVAPIRERPERKARERFLALNGKPNEKAKVLIEEALPASHFQKVDTLFVPHDQQRWGRHDNASGDVDLHSNREPQDTELLNRLAINTLRYGGSVFPVRSDEIPGGNEIAAILR